MQMCAMATASSQSQAAAQQPSEPEVTSSTRMEAEAEVGTPPPPPPSSSWSPPSPSPAAARVAELLEDRGRSIMLDDPDMRAAVRTLMLEEPQSRPAEKIPKGELGQGVWEVFHAPHFQALATALGARFEPIRYTLAGNAVNTNTKFVHPLLGEGWMSASGKFYAKDGYTLQVSSSAFPSSLIVGDERREPALGVSRPSPEKCSQLGCVRAL